MTDKYVIGIDTAPPKGDRSAYCVIKRDPRGGQVVIVELHTFNLGELNDMEREKEITSIVRDLQMKYPNALVVKTED